MLRFLERKINLQENFVFRKDTFSDAYTNFSSFVALKHKFGLVYTLLHRSFTIVSNFPKSHFEIETLKKALHKNA